jgi:ABC-2 type transport system permease protein
MIFQKLIAVLKKDAISALRYRNGFLLAIAAPGAQLTTFYYLARAIGPQFRPEGMPYFLFLLAGTGFYTFLLAGPYSFLRTIQEAQQAGTLEVLLTTATPAPVLVSLAALSAFAASLLQFAIYIAAGLFFATPARFSISGIFAVLLFSGLIAFAVGLLAAGLQISVQKGSAALWLLGSICWLISGTLFPVSALPHTARVLSFAMPFTHALSGMRLALTGQSPATLAREIELLGLFSLLAVPASWGFFSWTVRRARQNGTLSFY